MPLQTLGGWFRRSTRGSPHRPFEHPDFATDEPRRQIRLLGEDMAAALTDVSADLEARTLAAGQKRTEVRTVASDPRRRVALMTEAATAVFGEAFRILPRFTLDPEIGATSTGRDGVERRHDLPSPCQCRGVEFPRTNGSTASPACANRSPMWSGWRSW